MDASYDVGPGKVSAPEVRSGDGSVQREPEEIRREIFEISADLRDKVVELKEYARKRLGAHGDPLHIREFTQSRPGVACGVALALGVCCGALKVPRAALASTRAAVGVPNALVRGVVRTAVEHALQLLIQAGTRR